MPGALAPMPCFVRSRELRTYTPCSGDAYRRRRRAAARMSSVACVCSCASSSGAMPSRAARRSVRSVRAKRAGRQRLCMRARFHARVCAFAASADASESRVGRAGRARREAAERANESSAAAMSLPQRALKERRGTTKEKRFRGALSSEGRRRFHSERCHSERCHSERCHSERCLSERCHSERCTTRCAAATCRGEGGRTDGRARSPDGDALSCAREKYGRRCIGGGGGGGGVAARATRKKWELNDAVVRGAGAVPCSHAALLAPDGPRRRSSPARRPVTSPCARLRTPTRHEVPGAADVCSHADTYDTETGVQTAMAMASLPCGS